MDYVVEKCTKEAIDEFPVERKDDLLN